MMFGLSDQGFSRKKLIDIKEGLEDSLRAEFGADIDLSSQSVFGQIVGVLSLPLAEMWEELENVYLSFDPDVASGVSLDSLCALNGITRLPSTATTVDAVLFGDVGTVIPALSEAINPITNEVFCLDNAVTISASNLVRAKISVLTVQNSTEYTITIDSTDYDITTDASATEDEILSAFSSALSAVDAFASLNSDNQIELSTSIGSPFTLTVSANLQIDEYGTSGSFSSKVKGSTLIPAGSLNTIQTTVVGWDAVLNPSDGTRGRDIETDSELRFRRKQSVSLPAASTVDSLKAKILQKDDVVAAEVYENSTGTTDANGVPTGFVWVIVQGGDADEIAQIIYENKAGGIGSFGSTTGDITTDSGQIVTVNFDRPSILDLYVDMTITTNADFPADGLASIKTAIADWVAANLSIGEDLLYSRLFTPINTVDGFEVTDLNIGTSASPTGEVSISTDVNELITSITGNITITVS